MVRKILLILALILLLIQFIRPSKNENTELITADDISRTYVIPDTVHNILIRKCYDCHSEHTNYPWYFYIQPVAWWLDSHIRNGKAELNFSAFQNYPEKTALSKLEKIGEVIGNETMPLSAYSSFHPETRITAEEKTAIQTWLTSMNIRLPEQDQL